MSIQAIKDSFEDTLKQDGLFCLLGHSFTDFIASLSLLSSSHQSFVFQERQKSVFEKLDEPDQQTLSALCHSRALGCFFNHSSKNLNLKRILRDTERLSLPRRSGLCVILSENSFDHSSPTKLQQDLGAWRRFCRRGQYRIMFLVYGPCETLRPLLNRHSKTLSGIAIQTRISKSRYSLLIDHWLSPKGMLAQQEFLLTLDNHRAIKHFEHVSQAPPSSAIQNSDVDTIYTVQHLKEELYQSANVIAEQTDNTALFESLDDAVAATVIFDCQQAEDIETLALMIYQLRASAGDDLKILVRESSRCLRAADEAYLLRAGCSLIIPHGVDTTAVHSLVSAIQGHVFKRSLPPSLSKLIETRPYSSEYGYTEPATFSRYARRAFDNNLFSELQHLIVELMPLPGISIEQILGLCRLRREGDLLTVVNGKVYFFLYACSLRDAETALRNSLDLPVNDLFASRLLHCDADDIDELLDKLLLASPFINAQRARKLLDRQPQRRPLAPSSKWDRALTFAKRRRLDITTTQSKGE
ncbi:cellulose biosynthesis protein BcsE [Spongiibacter marinus]|uniref:cellulose biosynthesis protein BcsE n=1 Tax=Spongiibacter marinus TaxID=354246 RepID=UPI0004294D54|nr:cellulose biosynthesis protein BcsE [Spongiibacter marinus]